MTETGCAGFRWSGVAAGIKKNGQKDMGLIYADRPATAAAVFTRNRVQAAPVVLDRERIKSGRCQAVVVNSGNANCCTGEEGLADARTITARTAEALAISEELVLIASTGVIGSPLPLPTIIGTIPEAVRRLSATGLFDFADSIMTTDKFRKVAVETGVMADGSRFTISGVAKGAGMIRPDMATMLCFVCTDIQADPELLAEALDNAAAHSFHRITVDGDTSTNDTVILLASGVSSARLTAEAEKTVFQKHLDAVLLQLARMIVKDGEGATKVVEIVVKGASSTANARKAAETVAHSPLVKTAFFGADANWGRIMAALGRSDVDFQPSGVDIFFDTVKVVENGLAVGGIAETQAAEVLRQDELCLLIDLKTGGQGTASLLTCDLSLEYVTINSDYRS